MTTKLYSFLMCTSALAYAQFDLNTHVYQEQVFCLPGCFGWVFNSGTMRISTLVTFWPV